MKLAEEIPLTESIARLQTPITRTVIHLGGPDDLTFTHFEDNQTGEVVCLIEEDDNRDIFPLRSRRKPTAEEYIAALAAIEEGPHRFWQDKTGLPENLPAILNA